MPIVAPHQVTERLQTSPEQVAAFCGQHAIRRLAVFGSILRDDFGETSDIDVLIEFHPGKTPGLQFFGIQEELSWLFRRPVDLHTPASISRYFRSQVLSEAEELYVAG